jgi:hypothetical protein
MTYEQAGKLLDARLAVIEAAKAWRADLVHHDPRDVELEATLVRAIDALQAAEGER